MPEKYLNEFIAYSVVFKTGLIGLTTYLYLDTRPQRIAEDEQGGGKVSAGGDDEIYRRLLSLFFAIAYTVSGFLMAYNWNFMWLDAIIMLPFVLTGLENLVFHGKPFLYCIALAIAIYSNFYLSIMICIFLVIYFVYLYLIKFAGALRHGWGALWRFAFFSLLAGGIVSVMLIPEIYVLLGNDFSRMSVVREESNYFPVLDVLGRHCISVMGEHTLAHWPNIYCGTSVFLFVPLYVFQEKTPVRRRFGMLVIAGFMLLSFCNPFLDWLWHGMKYPQGLPARESFLYCLWVVIICHECAVNLNFDEKSHKYRILGAYVFAVLSLLFIEKSVHAEWMEEKLVWLTLVFVTIYAVIFYKLYSWEKGDMRSLALFLLLCTIVLEAQINAVDTNAVTMNVPEYNMEPQSIRAL